MSVLDNNQSNHFGEVSQSWMSLQLYLLKQQLTISSRVSLKQVKTPPDKNDLPQTNMTKDSLPKAHNILMPLEWYDRYSQILIYYTL